MFSKATAALSALSCDPSAGRDDLLKALGSKWARCVQVMAVNCFVFVRFESPLIEELTMVVQLQSKISC